MDKEQAKFILGSFRPDGADAEDETFAEALHLAAEDRELGEWLARERATDAVFAEALMNVEIPEDLRSHILTVMHGESLGDPEAEQAMDEMLSGALDNVEPPAGLRDQILAAMDVQKQDTKVVSLSDVQSTITGKKNGWKNMRGLLAVAAALVLGAFLALQMNPLGLDGRISTYDVQQHAGKVMKASFSLDVKNEDPQELNSWLINNQLPIPTSLPKGLEGMTSVGCKQMILPGETKAAMVCFREDKGGMLHVIIIPNEAVGDKNLPDVAGVSKKNCYFCPKAKMDVARWQDETNTYVMLGKPQKQKENTLMRFF